MNIEQLRPGQPERLPRGPHVKIGDSTPSATAAGASGPDQVNASQDVRRVPDAEVVQLVQKLNEAPGVRPDLISAAKQRLVGGEYLTRQAAEQTAAAILGEQ